MTVVLSCLLVAAIAHPSAYIGAISSQYHAQDEHGQYSYGYADPNSQKHESRSADGITQGAYSYVDGHGIIQSVKYVSDPIHGFQVAATNLPQAPVDVAHVAAVAPAVSYAVAAPAVSYAAPVAYGHYAHAPVALTHQGVPVETPEVQLAKAAHFAAHAEAHHNLAHAHSGHYRKRRSIGVSHLASPALYGGAYSYSSVAHHAPLTVAPVAYAAHAVAPVSYAHAVAPAHQTQFHAQDEHGQYTYGYTDHNSQKQESRSADGTTHGGYSYVDGNGIIQSVKYTADHAGFRVAATNLPVGPVAPAVAVAHHVAPVAVHAVHAVHAPVVIGAHGVPLETPEVVAAKHAHFAAHAEANARHAHAW